MVANQCFGCFDAQPRFTCARTHADVGTSRLCARRDEIENYLLRWNFQQDKITSFKDGGLLVRYSGQGNMLWVVHWPNGTSCIYGRGTIDPPPDPGT